MDYLLKSSALLLLMYLGYALFLKKETFFTHNRWFLFFGIITATLLPLIQIPVYIEVETATEAVIPFQFQYVPTEIIEQEQPINWLQLATYIYFAGVVVFFIQFLFQFGSLILLLLKNSKNSVGIYTYVIIKSKISPFSFFKWIVYNPDLFSNDELQLILNHEKVHVRQWHSLDILISRLACIAFWFNPICWFYHKSIQQNLEYIADDETQNTTASEKKYQELLLKTTVRNTDINLTSNFYNSLIKKRIVMLQKSRSKSIKRWKSALVIPFFILFLMSFNTKEVYVEIDNQPKTEQTKAINFQSNTKKLVEAYFSKTTSKDQIKTITKQLKEEGITLKINKIKRNSKNIITNLKVTFTKDDDVVNYAVKGNEGIPPFYFKSENDTMKVEAIEIIEIVETPIGEESPKSNISKDTMVLVEELPKKTVRANYSFISEDTTVINKPVTKNKKSKYALVSNVKRPILLVNGKRIPFEKGKKIDTSKVATYNIIKAEEAIKTYGDDGSLGVMVITLKEGYNDVWKISNGNNDIEKNKGNKNFTLRNPNAKDPIYILNGKRIDEKELKKTNPKDIDKVNVLKDKKAIKAYGNDGENGVIEIFTKNKTSETKVNSWGVTVGDNKTFPETSKKQLNSFIEKNKKPLIIVNNEILGKVSIKDFDYNIIKSISVFKEEKATEMYGEKGKDGVIIIETKDEKESQKLRKPNEIVTLSSMKYVDDDDSSKNATLYYINKNSKDNNLDEVVENLKAVGITVKFSKVKRNRDGEIMSIKISLSDNNGQTSSSTWKNNKKPIPQIAIGKSGDSLIASSSASFQN